MKSTLWPRVALAALTVLIICLPMTSADASVGSIKVVCDHHQGTSKAERSANGGLSLCVKLNGKTVLFDVGDDSSLTQNLQKSGVDASRIEAVVLSHNNPDRVRGLTDVLQAFAGEPKVYVPAPAAEETTQQNSQAEAVTVSIPTAVMPDAWLVPIQPPEDEGGTSVEQVLVLDQNGGLVVIVGCSHPDIISVVKQVKEVFGYRKIKLVAGGIHLRGVSRSEVRDISVRLQGSGIKSLALSNCTSNGALKIFRQEWGDRMVSLDLGDSIDF